MFKAAFLLFMSMFFLACQNGVEKIRPERKNITESVYSSAVIQPDSLYEVFAIINGILDKNLVEEGQLVQEDEPLFQIINNNPKLNAENARLTFQQAKNNLNGNAAILSGIQDQIDAAILKWHNDSINYFRQKNLWENKIGSQAEYDAKKMAYQLSQNALKRLRGDYERTKLELGTLVKQAENNYKNSVLTTQDYTVKSKITGKVYALYKNPGELVTTLEPLGTVGHAKAFVIELLVDEVDIVKIALDQKVIVALDAYENEIFTAKVRKIYPKKDERNQTFLVEAIFDEQPEILYPGLSGEANILIDERKDVLTIPKNYLIDDHKVMTEDGELTIEIGIQNLDYVEVVSGITEDTWITKPEE